MAVKRRSVLNVVINGKHREDMIPDNLLLVDYLRDTVGLTGTKIGCDGGECGCCTVLVNGSARHSCLTLALMSEGCRIETVEGLGNSGRLSILQQAFHKNLGSQCGFCTPGFIMAADALLRHNPDPKDSDIREALASNICRCTGYVKIVDSVRSAAKELRK